MGMPAIQPRYPNGTNPFVWDESTLKASKALIPKKGLSTVHDDPTHADPQHDEPGFYNPQTLGHNNLDPEFFVYEFDPEGFPTIRGIPVWERLPDEPTQYHDAFMHYLRLNRPRNLRALAQHLHGDPEVMITLAAMWNWSERAQYFDKFAEMQRARQRIELQFVTEESHRTLAEKMRQKAEQALENIDTDDLSVGQIESLIELSAKLERISTGLNPDTPNAPEPKSNKNAPTEDDPLTISGHNVQVNFTKDWKSLPGQERDTP